MTITDICIPAGNEQEFLDVARKLQIKSILFLYDAKKEIKKEELEELKQKNKDIKITTAQLITKNTNKPGMNFAKVNIQTIENKHITHLYDFESHDEKDNHHYRRSGLNQAAAKKIKQFNKTMIIGIEQLITNKEPQLIIGRIQQNLELAKKYKLNVAIASMAGKPENMRPAKEMQALIKTLGHEEIAKSAIEEITKQLRDKTKQQ